MTARMLTLVLTSLIPFFDWSLQNGTTPNELDMNDKLGVDGINTNNAQPEFYPL